METKKPTDLNDQELLQQIKKMKTHKISMAVLVGLFIGVAAFSTYKKGLGLFTFLPLVMVVILVINSKKDKIVEEKLLAEMKSRNLS